MAQNHASYPKGEKVRETYFKTEESRIRNEPTLVITSNDRRDAYYLYSVKKNGELTKLYKASSPPLLYKKYLLNGGKL